MGVVELRGRVRVRVRVRDRVRVRQGLGLVELPGRNRNQCFVLQLNSISQGNGWLGFDQV